MLKTGLGSKSFDAAKKDTILLIPHGSASFLTQQGNGFFQNLEKDFCEQRVLQHFDLSKPLLLETDASGKAIGGLLCQRDADMNWHYIAYYSYKMLLAEQN